MKSLILFEDEGYQGFFPLVFWRSMFELQVGRRIQLDQLAQQLGLPVAGVWTREWLAIVAAQRCGAPANGEAPPDSVLVNGRWICDEEVSLPSAPSVGVIDGEVAYVVCDADLASRLKPADMLNPARRAETLNGISETPAAGRLVRYPWEIIGALKELLISNWRPEDASIDSDIDSRVSLQPKEKIHVGTRTRIHPTAAIDATDGPIFISHDVSIGAYAVIDGPAYIGPGSQINPHAWLHGGNSIGPVCKLGGEIDGCVILGYTNKQHVGFLGHSYVGSWVNLGAGASNSDLKNTFGKIRVPLDGVEVDTGTTIFGAVIGDHAKLGINATIPTGAVIGLAASVATTRVLTKLVPSFGWITDDAIKRGDPGKLLDAATAMMARRGVDMTDDEVELFLDLGTRLPSTDEAAYARSALARGQRQ